jgi:hypothetical protein
MVFPVLKPQSLKNQETSAAFSMFRTRHKFCSRKMSRSASNLQDLLTIRHHKEAFMRAIACAVLLLTFSSLAGAQVPKANVFVGYSFMSADVFGSSQRENLNGWEASLEGKVLPIPRHRRRWQRILRHHGNSRLSFGTGLRMFASKRQHSYRVVWTACLCVISWH